MNSCRAKILLLDDSETVLEVTQEVLEEADFDVVTVSSSALLPSVFRREQPDLALIDVQMPVMEGGSVVELMLRSSLHRCPLILYSDQSEATLRVLAASCGATGYIRKTSDDKSFIQQLRQHLQAAPPAAVRMTTSQPVLVFVVGEFGRKVVADLMLGMGGECILLDTGDECLALLKTRRPHLILLELKMDPLLGIASCQAIRENPDWSQIPVVIVSSTDSTAAVMHAWRVGADDFLPRHFTADQLEPKIRAVRQVASISVRTVAVGQILLVDHNPFFTSRLGRMLEGSGYRLLCAKNPEEARQVAAAQTGKLVAILLDLAMLNAQPLELIRDLRRLSGAPVLGMSGLTASVELDKAVQALTGFPVADQKLPCESIVSQINSMLRRQENLPFNNRVPFFSLVEFRVGADLRWNSGFTYDLSSNGLFITTLNPALRGTQLELRLSFPTIGSALCKARVAWMNEIHARTTYSYTAGMGVQFIGLPDELTASIAKYTASVGGGRS